MPASFRPRTRFVCIAVTLVACSPNGDGQYDVSLTPTILVPRGVLTNASAVTLDVYDEKVGATCNASSGQTAGVTSMSATVAKASLNACTPGSGATFCGSLAITKSPDTLVFAAAALDSAGMTIAYGCATAVVDAVTANVSISMVSAPVMAVCGDGIIEPTEQCDPPASAGTTDVVCDANCHSKEETLSTGIASTEGPASFVWPVESGASGKLFAFFTDTRASSAGNANVALREMSDALEPVTSPSAVGSAILAPNDATSALPPSAAPGNQSQPAGAFVLGTYFYAFTDTAFGSPAIHMRSFDGTLTGQQSQATPIVLDGPSTTNEDAGTGTDAGSSGSDAGVETSDAPSIAVSGTGALFVAWHDATGPNAGQILGRTYSPTGSGLGVVTTVSVGASNEDARVAGTTTGWIVVWDDAKQIKMRVYSANGTPNGAEIIVSDATHTGTQDHPGIAVLGDGRAAVVWADHGAAGGTDIFVQRYDANFEATSGDQAAPLNDVITAGDQITPVIASMGAAGGSFAVAWVDSPSGQVRGRVLGGGTSGFASNPLDATTHEFQASIASGPQRENPVVSVGGAGPSIAIGWDVAGVVSARLFPTSTIADD